MSLKEYLKLLVKLLLTAAALYFVFRKIDLGHTLKLLSKINPFYFLLAFATFNVSKIISAYRLRQFYKAIGLDLDRLFNLRLYYVGMFYNLSLPGAIGGDGYKVFLLNQNKNKEVKLKDLILSTLMDRGSGLVYLLLLGLILLFFSSLELPIPNFHWLILISLFLLVPAYYLFIHLFFKPYIPMFWITGVQSLAVQIGQVICALFLLLGLGVKTSYPDYLSLFMFSSVAAVLPLTLGGVGLREIVFLYGKEFLEIQETTSIAFTLSFFIVTVLSSLIGLFFTVGIDKNKES